jgi:hypothetical protein
MASRKKTKKPVRKSRKSKEFLRRSAAAKRGAETRRKKLEFIEGLKSGDPKPSTFGAVEFVGVDKFFKTDFEHRVYELHGPGVGPIRDAIKLEQEGSGENVAVFATISWTDKDGKQQHRSTDFYLVSDDPWDEIQEVLDDYADEYGIEVTSGVSMSFTTGM